MKLLWFLLFVVVVSAKVRYDKYQVLRIIPETRSQVEALRKMEDESTNGLSFWTSARGLNHPVDVMVPPGLLQEFYDSISKHDLNSEIFIEDVQKAIEDAGPRPAARATYDWTNYYDLETLYEWMRTLSRTHPRIVSTFVAGRTFEGREILGVKLSYKTGNPTIFVESGIHAREWIAPATATWILNELITSNDRDVRFIAENFDWYIVPSCNPDGYEYTFTTNRMWRKTRTPGNPCYGVDPNRNWDDRWNQGGASTNTCAETYAGTGPFSTIETATLASTIANLNPKVYLCFHSYSELLMIPYGHRFQNASNYNELMALGKMAATSLAERYGTQYKVGPIVDVIYVATGGSMDWVKSHLDVPYTFEWELRDKGRHGFLLPPEQIIPTALETFDSIITILKGIPYNNL